MAYRPNDLLSVTKAAKEKGVDAATIRRACAKGKLKCTKIGVRAWVVRWGDLEGWAPSTRGRKRKDAEAGERDI